MTRPRKIINNPEKLTVAIVREIGRQGGRIDAETMARVVEFSNEMAGSKMFDLVEEERRQEVGK